MSSPTHQLLAEAEAFMVEEVFGEEISYKRRGQTPVVLEAMVSNSDVRGSSKKYAEDETVFYSVEMNFKPRENDEIKYMVMTYIVKPHSDSTSNNGRYDIVTLSHQALKHRRENR